MEGLMLISGEQEQQEKEELDRREVMQIEHDLGLRELKEPDYQYLIDHPPKLCEEPRYCPSRNISGEYCQCMREIFMTLQQFDTYKRIVADAIKQEAKIALGVVE